MRAKIARLLNIKPGEWTLVVSLLLLLAINTTVLELSDVVSTTGFISNIGTSKILWLWLVDMAVTILSAGVYALIIDRTARIQLVGGLLIGFAFLYLLLRMLFSYGAPDWVTYPLLYILSDQQYAIFPLAFWALANDVYSMSESKRLFPVIAAGGTLGNVLGNGLAASSATLFSGYGSGVPDLLLLSTLLFLIGFALLWFTFRKRDVRARQAREEGASARQILEEGSDFIKNVPLFRYLAIAMLLVGLALTIIEYHFLFTVDQAVTNDPARFQAFYGIYKIALIAATWLFQWLITGKLLEKVGTKNTFTVLPASLIVAAGGGLALPGLVGGAGGRFLARLVQTAWDEPARKTAEGLVPDERRGRVSTFLDTYYYSVATIVGCLVMGALFLGSSLGWLAEQTVIAAYLTVAALAAAGAVWAALRLRSVYDQSLLNWRLSRSRRKSVLDGIDF